MTMFNFKKTKIPRVVIGINQVDNLGPWDSRLNLPTESTEKAIARRTNAIVELLSKGSHSAAKEQIEHYSALRAYRMYQMLAKIAQNCKEGIIIPDKPVNPWDTDKFPDMPEDVREFYLMKASELDKKMSGMGIDSLLGKILDKLDVKDQKKLKEKWAAKKNTPIRVGILGKAGVGKTTTVNNLFNATFKTSRNAVGTTKAQYKDFELPDGGVITIVDMPGYGRSMDEDETYKQIYLQELPKCDIILLVVQADTRDLTDDQIMIENLYEWSKEGRI